MIEYQHVLPKYRPLLGRSDSERLAEIRPRWIPYAFAAKVHELLYAKLSGHRDQPDIFLLGDSRMGKTKLISQFIKVRAPEFINSEGGREKPVLMVEVDQPSVKKLMLDILDTSISPYNPDSSSDKLFYQVMNLLHRCNTKMLVIDEIQCLYQGTAREVTAITKFIKRVSNKTGISIVGVGVKPSRQLLTKDDQYASRFVTATMPKWAASEAFQQFLMGFESSLPLRLPSRLYSPEMSAVILEKSEGNTARIEELVLECAREAIVTGRERIDLDLLSKQRWKTDTFGTRELIL